MAIYYAAVEGDPLDSGEGGYIYATKRTIGTIEDGHGKRRNMVFIGDEGYCAKCKGTGAITYGAGVSDSRRMVDLVNGGRRQAVGGDIVLCQCATPTRITAIYGRKFTIRDDTGGVSPRAMAEKLKSTASDALLRADKPRHVRWFIVWDAASGAPLRNRDYMANVGGAEQSGKTDEDGYAKIETHGEQTVDIHVVFSSPRRTLKPYQGA